jgi:hypothetical protein
MSAAEMLARYALAEAAPGGLLMNLESGALYRLNEAALLVWRAALSGRDRQAVAAELAGRYALSPERALADVESALDPRSLRRPARPPADFEYRRASGGYELWFRGSPALAVDERGAVVRALEAGTAASRAGDLLQAVAPKLIALRGNLVLHAAAVRIGEGALAFAGASGAGKTTNARTLAAAGAEPICEDVLVLRIDQGAAEVPLGAEGAIDAWVEQSVGALSAGRDVDAATLDAVLSPPYLPLREVAFIAADRRAGIDAVAEPLAPADAAAGLFENAFHGADAAESWTGSLAACCQLACAVRAFAVSMPESLEALERIAPRIVSVATLRAP